MRIIGKYTDAELQEVLAVVQAFPGGMKSHNFQNTVDNTDIREWSQDWRSYFIEFTLAPWVTWAYGGLGSPSYSSGGVHTAMMLINIFAVLRRQGWELVCEADVSAKYVKTKNTSYSIDTDEWFFIKIE